LAGENGFLNASAGRRANTEQKGVKLEKYIILGQNIGGGLGRLGTDWDNKGIKWMGRGEAGKGSSMGMEREWEKVNGIRNGREKQ
jgi:hypothetical protein